MSGSGTGAALATACRVVLAVVFAFSAARKLGAGSRAARSMEDFGMPAPRLAAAAVTAAEAALALALLVWHDRAWPSGTALALLGAFTVAVAVNLRRGRAVPCPCFGASERPVSGATLIRNGWLAAVAVIGTGSSAGAGGPATAGFCLLLGAATVAVIRRTR